MKNNLNPLILILEGIYTDKIVQLQKDPKIVTSLTLMLKKGNPFRKQLADQIRSTHKSGWIPSTTLRKLKSKIISLENQLSTSVDASQRSNLKQQLNNLRSKLKHVRKYGMLDGSGRNTNMDAIGRIGQDMETLLDKKGLGRTYKITNKTITPDTFGNKVRKLFGIKPKTKTKKQIEYSGGFLNPDIWSRKLETQPIQLDI